MNRLYKIQAFRKALTDYRISPTLHQLLTDTKMAFFVGPSASGRNSIIQLLVDNYDNYHPVVSDTTRNPRVDDTGRQVEEDGVQYWFCKENFVLSGVKRGEYIGPAIIHEQQVSGIHQREIQKAYEKRHIATTDIEPQGARDLKALKPDLMLIFVIPADYDQWLTWLQTRSKLDEAEIERRMISAAKEIQMARASNYYVFIENANLDEAAKEADRIIKGGQVDPQRQKELGLLALSMQHKIVRHLKKLERQRGKTVTLTV